MRTAKKQAHRTEGSKGSARQGAKRAARPILRLGKVGKIKLSDIRKAVLEVRKRRAMTSV